MTIFAVICRKRSRHSRTGSHLKPVSLLLHFVWKLSFAWAKWRQLMDVFCEYLTNEWTSLSIKLTNYLQCRNVHLWTLKKKNGTFHHLFWKSLCSVPFGVGRGVNLFCLAFGCEAKRRWRGQLIKNKLVPVNKLATWCKYRWLQAKLSLTK